MEFASASEQRGTKMKSLKVSHKDGVAWCDHGPTVLVGKALLAARMVLVGIALSACAALVGCGGGGSSPAPTAERQPTPTPAPPPVVQEEAETPAPGQEVSSGDSCRDRCRTLYDHPHGKQAEIIIDKRVKKEIGILNEAWKNANNIKENANNIRKYFYFDDKNFLFFDDILTNIDDIIQNLGELRPHVEGEESYKLLSENNHHTLEDMSKNLDLLKKIFDDPSKYNLKWQIIKDRIAAMSRKLDNILESKAST